MTQSFDAPASSISLSQTISDIRFGTGAQFSYAQTLQSADSEINIQSGLLLRS